MGSDANVFGKRVKQLRQEKTLTQNELGKILGYSDRSAIAKIESGKNTVSTEKLKEFAKVLGTTTSYLLGTMEEDLKTMGVAVKHEGNCVVAKDELSARSVTFSAPDWRRLEEANNFQQVWSDLTGDKKPAPVVEDERSAIQAIFDQLSPENQTKLLELARLYLTAQNNTVETK